MSDDLYGAFTASFDVCPSCGTPALSWSIVQLGPDGVDEGSLVVCGSCDMRTGND